MRHLVQSVQLPFKLQNTSANRDLVKSIGADYIIDYAEQDFSDNGEYYDIILDAVGNLPFSKCRRSLTKTGRAVLVIPTLGTIFRSLANSRLVCGAAGESKEALGFLLELVDSGNIIPVIDTVYPREKVAQAHRYVDMGHKKGNVILAFDS